MKLFPNLQRLAITEHAKSSNYEDYIGIVLDKKNNTFKVVEGQFTDKKDMYEKMKARGLILRKAYERKVWEWVSANADGPIIAYLMLSTAFSKWRSNNVLHKYYQKLLNDIPELNREREKGNPNTRGGDFVTTDDEKSPERKDESFELDEDKNQYDNDEKHLVKLVGVKSENSEELPLDKKEFDVPENTKFPANIELLTTVQDLLSSGKYDEVNVQWTKDGRQHVVTYDLPKIQRDVNKYNDMKYNKQLGKSVPSEIKLFGINQDVEPIRLNSTDSKGEMTMPVMFDNKGNMMDPTIVQTIDGYFNSNEYENRTGVDLKDKYKKIKVYVDGNLKKTYDKNSVKNDLIKIFTNQVSYGITNASNVNKEVNNTINEIKKKLVNPDLTSKERKNLMQELENLRFQNKLASKEQQNSPENIKNTWQSRVYNYLKDVSSSEGKTDLRKTKDYEQFKDFLLDLTSNSEEKSSIERYIEDDPKSLNNTAFNMSNIPFRPFTSDELDNLAINFMTGKSIANDDKEKKLILHNLFYYLLADAKRDKESNKNYADDKADITTMDKLSDLVTHKQSIGTGGFNQKTQSGKRNADIQIGDDLKAINKELKRFGISEPKPKKAPEPSEQEKELAAQLAKQFHKMVAPAKKKPIVYAKDKVNLTKDQLRSMVNNDDLLNKAEILAFRAKRQEFGDDVSKTREFYNENPEIYKSDVLANIDKAKEQLEKNESVKVTQYDNDGATLMHRYSPYQGKGFDYSAGPIKMTGQIVEDTTKTELNPKFFENDVLIPEVRDALYKIATVFKDYLDLPFEVKDIYFTGSNANYNYTEDSDIDLHLVYDFEQAGVNAELLSKYLVAAKKDFNNKYDIKVKDQPVELGCENISEPLISTGVYSLGANTWVIKPENSGIEIPDVDMNAFNDLSMQIDDTIKAQNASAIENLWKKIRELRKDSLSSEGEFGMGNMLFKKLRNSHYLDKLRDKMYATQSKELSLESSEELDEAELNDKKDFSEFLKELKDEVEAEDTKELLTDKSLIQYLDGYKNRNEKTENKEENGVLKEGDIPNWKLNRALKYMSNDIPSEISKYRFVDSDGVSLCRFKYDPKEDEIYKIPVVREEVVPGSYQFVSVMDQANVISYREFYDILYSDINQELLSKTSLYNDLEQMTKEIETYKDNKAAVFNKWYEENKDYLDLDDISPDNKKLRNLVLRQMYNDNINNDVNVTNLRKKYSSFYKQSVEEAMDARLSVNNDMNDINAIFTAIGLDPRYVTRPIYEYVKKRNDKTFDFDDIERQWKIVGMDDVRSYLKDGKFDSDSMPYSKVNVYMKDVNSPESRPEKFNLVELNNIIKSSEENDINNNSPKIAYDIHKQLPYNSNKFRQQTRQTYTERMLTLDQVKKALEYVQSPSFADKTSKQIEILKNQMSGLNSENEEDKKLINSLQREINYRQSLLDFGYTGNGSLIDLYDSLTSMKQNGFAVIVKALNAVEDGVRIIPRYSVQDPHGFAFYIKLPTEGFTYEEIKNHGSYDPRDTINDVMKANGSF